MEMEYVDIAHECSYPVWLWSYDTELKCKKTRKKGHEYDEAIASGRVDPVLEVGSIAFSPNLGYVLTKKIIDSLLVRFPGVKFYVFGNARDPVVSLSRYIEQTYD